MKITQRSHEKEIIDLGPTSYQISDYFDCLYQLDRIGHYLGGHRKTIREFKKLPLMPTSICDYGCGGGGFTLQLAKKYPEALIYGVDISSDAICYAKNLWSKSFPTINNVRWIHAPTQRIADLPQNFDVITASLLCHHLDDRELIDFLSAAYSKANHAVILNDLHRSPIASLSFKLIAPLLFPNPLICHDGLISIQRGFKKNEWVSLLKEAKIPLEHCSITWHWAFRWIVRIWKASL